MTSTSEQSPVPGGKHRDELDVLSAGSRHAEELRSALSASLESEERLRQRNADLAQAVAELNDARRAALKLMEDALLAKNVLRDSERRFRELIDVLPAAVYTTDAEGRITHFNRACIEFSGRTPELGTDQWCVTWKLYHADGTPMSHDRCPMAIALKERRAVRGIEAIAERPDGTRVWFEPYPTPLFDADGRVTGGVNMLVDITERKQSEKARAQLAAVVESSDDAIVTNDLDCIITSWNRGAERLFGYEAAEVIGRPVAMLMPPERVDEASGIVERIRRGESVDHYETVRRRKDGALLDVSLSVSPMRDAGGRIVGASKIARDITERRRAEEALRQSEQRLAAELDAVRRLHELSLRLAQAEDFTRLLEEILDAAIGISGADMGNLQLLENGVLKITVQRGFGAEFIEFSSKAEPGTGACGSALQSGRRVIVEDVSRSPIFAGTPAQDAMLAAGVRAVQSTPLVSRSGRMLGMVSTHFRRAPYRPNDRELRALDLLARQAADVIERKQVEEALRDADRRKDEFLATLAHELRNPLAPIHNSLQILALAGDDGTAAARAREVIERQVGQMVRLVDDLMEVSRITRGKIELRKERTELAVVIQNAIETSRPLIDAEGHQLEVDLPEEPLLLEADAVRLAQVFANLLNNAAKYTDAGGRIRLTVRSEGESVVVSVRDNGTGIPADMLPKVFDVFTQVDRGYGRAQGGLGIGLTLVRSLVDLHGGSVEAKSDGEGCGSEFVVRLPLAAPRERMQRAAGHDAPAGSIARRILVVDDSRDAAETLGLLLELSGAEVRTANDGPAALAALDAFRPSVVLLDIGMPGMDGFEVARRMRQRSPGRDVALIALTGWGQAEDRHRSLEAGIDHHLVKPVDLAVLQRLLVSLPNGGRPAV